MNDWQKQIDELKSKYDTEKLQGIADKIIFESKNKFNEYTKDLCDDEKRLLIILMLMNGGGKNE